MRPKNFTARKKRILTFAGLYAASVILIFFIFSAFGVRFSVNDQKQDDPSAAVQAMVLNTNNDVLRTDSFLHASLYKLQVQDVAYLLLPDTASSTRRNNAAMAIGNGELAFKKSIDSIEQMTAVYTGAGAGNVMYQNMINSFRSVLEERRALKNIQSSITTGKSTAGSGSLDVQQWRNELALKENEITRMETALRALQDKSFAVSKTSGGDEAQKGENELLKTAFADQQKDYDALKNKYNGLKADNSTLATQVIEFKKNASVLVDNTNTVAEKKINVLEQKVHDLNADLYFARIDCNLARADAQQIISNARQRKELLSESLSMLGSLAKSEDADIQKKAKEKIVRLNRIATALHD
ncbi:MAG: hypothetical protein ABIQ88_16975 [Chitinophagaceae bacterium]